jgi:hypothetical protein
MNLSDPSINAWALFLRAVTMASVHRLSVQVDT